MPIVRKLVALPLLLMLFAASAPASAAPLATTHKTVRQTTQLGQESDEIKTKIVRGAVEWTLPANQCSSLPAGVSVSGTGERVQVISTRKGEDGSTKIIDNDFVEGTAVDSAGHTYHFIYANQARQQVPRRRAPINVDMTDSFILTDDAGGNPLVVAFVWRWTYSPPAELWPPADNLQQDYTQGDAFTCDPI